MNKIKQIKNKSWKHKTAKTNARNFFLKFQNPTFPNSPIQRKIKIQNPNPKACTKFHKSKNPKIPDSLTQKCVSTKCVWTLDPLQNQKHAPKSVASTKSQPRLKIQNNIISLQSQGPPVACFWMPKEGCIKNQFVQGGNGLDFVEEIGGGIIFHSFRLVFFWEAGNPSSSPLDQPAEPCHSWDSTFSRALQLHPVSLRSFASVVRCEMSTWRSVKMVVYLIIHTPLKIYMSPKKGLFQ